MDVPKEETYKYGIIEADPAEDDSLFKMSSIVEKPKPEDSPSTFGSSRALCT